MRGVVTHIVQAVSHSSRSVEPRLVDTHRQYAHRSHRPHVLGHRKLEVKSRSGASFQASWDA